ncbi:MAG TPA: hypothetical protein VFN11_14395 [Ktedonobacterales bacterium]|nr:hypothetical protein [Ktedonobacterales bacterium]
MTNEQDDMAMVPYEARNPGLVLPLVDSSTAKAAIQQYEALKAAIVRPDDVQRINNRDFLKKAFWRRVATCFGLSLELVSQERGFDEAGHLYYSVMYKAVAPNGRTMDADGYCSTAENGRDKWPEHNVRATAHTRAKNRAISDLVGGGEVSAEEMPDDEPRQQVRQQQQPQRPTPINNKRQAPAPVQVYAVPSEPEPLEEVDDAGERWPFISDVDFRQALNKAHIRTVDAVQQFVERVTQKPCAEARRADRTVCMEQAIELAKTAVPASLEGLPVGKRGL